MSLQYSPNSHCSQVEFGLSDPVCFWWQEHDIGLEVLRKIIQTLEITKDSYSMSFQGHTGALFNMPARVFLNLGQWFSKCNLRTAEGSQDTLGIL